MRRGRLTWLSAGRLAEGCDDVEHRARSSLSLGGEGAMEADAPFSRLVQHSIARASAMAEGVGRMAGADGKTRSEGDEAVAFPACTYPATEGVVAIAPTR